jgi:hypothetical protein
VCACMDVFFGFEEETDRCGCMYVWQLCVSFGFEEEKDRCVCVYVSMHVCVEMCVCVHVWIFFLVLIKRQTYMYVCSCADVCVHECMDIHVCLRKRQTGVDVCMFVCM